MQAVRRIDLQPRVFSGGIPDNFIHARRTVALFWRVILCQIDGERERFVLELQVAGLIFLVMSRRKIDRGHHVEGDDPIRFRIVDHRARAGCLQLFMVGGLMAQGPGGFATQQYLIDAEHQTARIKPLGHPRLEITRPMQFVMKPALFKSGGISRELVMTAPGNEGRKAGFCGQHPGFDRTVRALDAGTIEESGVIADQRATREGQFWQRLQTACRQRPGTVGDAPATEQKLAQGRVRLESLKFVEGREVRIRIAQADDQPDRDEVIVAVVHEAATVGCRIHRPAAGMNDQAGAMFVSVDFPQFLDADAVNLRVFAFAQAKFLLKLLAQLTTATFGKQGVSGDELHPRLPGRSGMTVFQHPGIASRHPQHRALFIVENFHPGKARIDFHAQRFCLLTQPAAEIRQTDDVIACIVKAVGQRKTGNTKTALLAKHQETVFLNRHLQGSAKRLPVWQKFIQHARIQHRSGKDVAADFC